MPRRGHRRTTPQTGLPGARLRFLPVLLAYLRLGDRASQARPTLHFVRKCRSTILVGALVPVALRLISRRHEAENPPVRRGPQASVVRLKVGPHPGASTCCLLHKADGPRRRKEDTLTSEQQTVEPTRVRLRRLSRASRHPLGSEHHRRSPTLRLR